MRLYYDTTNTATYPQSGAPSWTRVSGIITFPKIRNRMDETGVVVVVIGDKDGSLKGTWDDRNFTRMEIRDEAANVVFRGYLTSKKFQATQFIMGISGISKAFQWTPLDKDYVYAEGFISAVPSAEVLPLVDNLLADTDTNVNWNVSGGNHHDAVAAIGGHTIGVGDGDENAIEEFDLTTISGITEATSVTIYIYGSYLTADKSITVDFDDGGGYIGGQNITFGNAGEYIWKSKTFAGLSMNQAEVNACTIKITANAAYGVMDGHTIDAVYVELTYTGVNVDAIDLVQNDEARSVFNWPLDYWIEERDVGILIRDNTTGIVEKVYTCTGLNDNATGENEVGTHAGLSTDGDGFVYKVEEVDETVWNCVVDLTVEGDDIPDTNTIQYIEIEYNFLVTWIELVEGSIELQINKDGTWERVGRAIAYGGNPDAGTTGARVKDKTKIEVDLTDYLDDDGVGNYDSILGMRFKFNGDYRIGNGTVRLTADFLKVTIGYHADDISPIMEKIDDNGASWIEVVGANWGSSGVSDGGVDDGDSFKIGENTAQILHDVANACGVNIRILSTGTKYIAQWFKGNYGLGVLKKVCLLEGWHWREDYSYGVFGEVVISHLDDCEDSGVNITQADHDHDWYYEDDPNFYKTVIVYGAAAYRIKHIATDPTIQSPLTKIVYEETITTNGEAKDVAEIQLLEWKVKHPSIKLPLKGVHAAIKVGTEITLTMARPTVAEANYPVRMVEREGLGHAEIKTTVYAGMGHTSIDEAVSSRINKIMYLAQKAHADRLSSTPLGAGATGLAWGDITGGDSAVDSRIAVQNTHPAGTIDVAIDALIATHATTPHAVMTEAQLFQTEVIGVGNKKWRIALYKDESTIVHQWECAGGLLRNSYAGAGRDDYLHYETDLPMYKIVKGVTYWLYINALKVYVGAADAGDYINQVFAQGNQADGGGVSTEINDVNPGVGATNITAPGEYDIDVNPFDCNNGGDPYIGLTFSCYNHTSGNRDLSIYWMKYEYYYNTV